MMLLQKLKKKLVQKVFSKYYGHFEYPFFSADAKLHQLAQPHQLRYYEDVKRWIESDAYKNEHEAAVKDFYRELAIKPLTEEQIAGYRLALIFIKNYEGRLGALSRDYETLKITSDRATKL